MPNNKEALSAFEDLFRRNYPLLCQRVFRITADLAAAEDIVQEAFISYWSKIQEQPVQSPEAYLSTACLHKALNYTSVNKRRAQLIQEQARQQAPSSRTPAQALEEKELAQRVQQAIASLPPKCRQVFLLSRHEEMSHKEIAAFLQISPNTVDNHLKKALSILRKALLGGWLILPEFYFSFFC